MWLTLNTRLHITQPILTELSPIGFLISVKNKHFSNYCTHFNHLSTFSPKCRKAFYFPFQFHVGMTPAHLCPAKQPSLCCRLITLIQPCTYESEQNTDMFREFKYMDSEPRSGVKSFEPYLTTSHMNEILFQNKFSS